jgi:hypothetical protein
MVSVKSPGLDAGSGRFDRSETRLLGSGQEEILMHTKRRRIACGILVKLLKSTDA